MNTRELEDLPSGREYMEGANRLEDECQGTSDAALARAGKKMAECLVALPELLVQVDAIASCFCQCLGGDHRFEYLAGRLLSSTRAALLLLRRGFYDESFNLTRSVGELANLLFLLSQDESLVDEWVGASDAARRTTFSPVKVRLAIEARSLPVPIDEARYRSLSGIATHVGPETRPNVHLPWQRPRVGGHFDLASAMAALNEVAGAAAVGSFAIALLVKVPKQQKLALMKRARDVLAAVGGVSLDSLLTGEAARPKQDDG